MSRHRETPDEDFKALSADQLRQRLEEHQANRPDPFSSEFMPWMERKGKITFALDCAIGAERTAWKPAPGPTYGDKPRTIPAPLLPKPKDTPSPEEPMSKPSPREADPSARLEHLLTRLKEAEGTPRVHQIRFSIRQLCEAHGLPVPEAAQKLSEKAEPESPASAASEGLGRPLEAAIDLGRAIERFKATPSKAEDIRTHIRGIRRQIWSLMSDLEGLTPEGMAPLQAELGLLDAAAHAAHQLSLGRLEIA